MCPGAGETKRPLLVYRESTCGSGTDIGSGSKERLRYKSRVIISWMMDHNSPVESCASAVFLHTLSGANMGFSVNRFSCVIGRSGSACGPGGFDKERWLSGARWWTRSRRKLVYTHFNRRLGCAHHLCVRTDLSIFHLEYLLLVCTSNWHSSRNGFIKTAFGRSVETFRNRQERKLAYIRHLNRTRVTALRICLDLRDNLFLDTFPGLLVLRTRSCGRSERHFLLICTLLEMIAWLLSP